MSKEKRTITSDAAAEDLDTQFRCTVCGQIGTVGRCCGLNTREPLNDLARAELADVVRRCGKSKDGKRNEQA